jgi:hypothetical protein
MSSKLHIFDDGGGEVTIKTVQQPNGEFYAIEADRPCEGAFPFGMGLTRFSAIADLLGKTPRAESEREERDAQASRFDHAHDLRKHECAR